MALETPASNLSLGIALLFAFTGGLLLNLMPCVFPVLSLKVFGFAAHGFNAGAMRAHALAFAGGVIVSFALLAGLLIALRAGGSQVGWGFQLQSPAVIAGLALLFFVLALNLSGMFEVGQLLPSSISTWSARNTFVNDALSGVLAVVIASRLPTPAQAPVTASAGATAGKQTLIAADKDHIAIQGYDPVAYFTDGKAIKGRRDFVYRWNDAVWQFDSAQHRDLFVGNPEAYMPQYGGYCAGSMANGNLTVANPNAWVIVDGKLYMFAGAKYLGGWSANDIAQADSEWRTRTGQ